MSINLLPKIYKTGVYFKNLLDYYQIEYTDAPGSNSQLLFKNFPEYNYLIKINKLFSANPSGDITDRTQQIPQPYQMSVDRPWKTPTNCISLENIFQNRILELESTCEKINIFWSGGIDSTVIVTAMLKHGDLKKYRILYTPESIAEYPEFYFLLSKFSDLELIDYSEIYLTQSLNGIFVTGAGGDGLTASLDESFIKDIGTSTLLHGWKEYFSCKTNDTKFLNFCEYFFNIPTKPITSILEARWWFYTACKLQRFPHAASDGLNDNQPMALGFFDCAEFEDYMYFNIDTIMPGANYNSYKQGLKDYIFSYYPDSNYYKNKLKINSLSISRYHKKKNVLNSNEYILMLETGERVRAPNLPFFSDQEFGSIYGNRFDYLFFPD